VSPSKFSSVKSTHSGLLFSVTNLLSNSSGASFLLTSPSSIRSSSYPSRSPCSAPSGRASRQPPHRKVKGCEAIDPKKRTGMQNFEDESMIAEAANYRKDENRVARPRDLPVGRRLRGTRGDLHQRQIFEFTSQLNKFFAS
jgi:hypothetical protein